jgi:hypothetical protein
MHPMTRSIRQTLVPAALLAAVLAVAFAAPASAATWNQVLRDCIANDGLNGDYTRGELNKAKRHVTGERIAYTECSAEISAAMGALRRGAGGDGGDGPSGDDKSADLNGDGVVTKKERRVAKLKQAKQDDDIDEINSALLPDSESGGPAGGSSDGDSLPLILAIVALTLAALAGGTWYAARRNPAIANALRRVPLSSRRG